VWPDGRAFRGRENLRELVEAGLAKAYDLSATTDDPFSGELHGMPPDVCLRKTSGRTSTQRSREWSSTNLMERGGRLITMRTFVPPGSRRDIDERLTTTKESGAGGTAISENTIGSRTWHKMEATPFDPKWMSHANGSIFSLA
jgi:hypothetical protein